MCWPVRDCHVTADHGFWSETRTYQLRTDPGIPLTQFLYRKPQVDAWGLVPYHVPISRVAGKCHQPYRQGMTRSHPSAAFGKDQHEATARDQTASPSRPVNSAHSHCKSLQFHAVLCGAAATHRHTVQREPAALRCTATVSGSSHSTPRHLHANPGFLLGLGQSAPTLR